MKRGAKRYSAWRIVSSSVDQVPVGKVLIDAGHQLDRSWTLIDRDTGDMGSCSGPRIARLCPTCVSDHRRPAPLAHEGPHGPEAPLYTEAGVS